MKRASGPERPIFAMHCGVGASKYRAKPPPKLAAVQHLHPPLRSLHLIWSRVPQDIRSAGEEPKKVHLMEAHMLRTIALVTTSLLFASPAFAAEPAMVVAKKDGFRFEY